MIFSLNIFGIWIAKRNNTSIHVFHNGQPFSNQSPFVRLLIVYYLVLHRAKADYGSAASALHELVINCRCILCDVHYPLRIVLEGLGYEIQNLKFSNDVCEDVYLGSLLFSAS